MKEALCLLVKLKPEKIGACYNDGVMFFYCHSCFQVLFGNSILEVASLFNATIKKLNAF